MVRRGRYSRSARDVAAAVVMLDRREEFRGLLPEGLAALLLEVLREAGVLSNLADRWIHSALADRLFAWHDRKVLPGISTGLLVRKRFVDDQVLAALQRGAEQLVVLGAGFDPLAARYRFALPGLRAIEVDHAPTQALKARAYEKLFEAEARPALVPLDLSEGALEDVLAGCKAFEPGLRTVFVAEGLTMYLSEPAVAALFAAFRSLTSSASCFVFSFLEADDKGRGALGRFPRAMRGFARLGGEPLRWAARRGDLAQYLQDHDLWPRAVPSIEELTATYLTGRPGARLGVGELFAVAERT